MLSKREAGALVGALVLHAAAAWWFGRDRSPAAGSGPVETATLDVEVEAPPPEALPPAEPEESPPPAAVAMTPSRANAHAAHQASPVAPLLEGPSVPAASATTDFTFNPSAAPTISNEALGLAGRNRFLGAPLSDADRASATPSAPEVTNVAPGVDQSMADALDAHDHDLGFDAAGPLVSLAEELTRPSDAPVNGRAVFEIVIDANGDISAIRVVDAGGAAASWEKVAEQMAATVRSRRIAWRRKGHALAVRLEVNSRWVLPSGQAAPLSPYAQSGQSSDPGAGVHFDLGDLGARASRSVHARILGEKRL